MANTASIVRWIPPFMDDVGDIRAGSPVLGPGQWKDMALAASWLIGRGGMLFSQGPSANYLSSADAIMGFYGAMHGREQIKCRIWFLGLALSSGDALNYKYSATGSVTLPNSEVQYWTLEPATDPLTGLPTDPPTGQTKNFRFVEVITSPTNTTETPFASPFIVTRDATSAAEVIISGLYCRDVPMQDVYTYAAAAQYTPDGVNGYKSGDVIQNITNSTVSTSALTATQASSTAGSGARNEARRSSLFSWSGNRTYVAITSTPGYTTIFRQAPPILGRFLHYSSGTTRETTRIVKVHVLADCTGGAATGTFRATESTASATGSVLVTGGTATWYSFDLAVDCDDMTRIDVYGGTRSGGRCTITFDGRVEGGTTLIIYAISVGEHRQL